MNIKRLEAKLEQTRNTMERQRIIRAIWRLRQAQPSRKAA